MRTTRASMSCFEGAQAVMLDVDWGSYPYVTSSTTVAAGAAVGTVIAPSRLDTVLGVSKVYATRVGEGPFVSETVDAVGDMLRERGGEYGVNTGRPRRWPVALVTTGPERDDAIVLRHPFMHLD